MKFEKITFGWRDIIYIASIVICVALWYIDRQISENNHQNKIDNLLTQFSTTLENISAELSEVTDFMDIQVRINEGTKYHIEDKNIHINKNNNDGD